MIIRRAREVPNIVFIITPSYKLRFRQFNSSRFQNEKIYNHAKDVAVTVSHVIGDAVTKGSTSKWRAKVTTIEESKRFSSLALDELIGNLKVHEVVMEKDFEFTGKKERVKSIALKAKKESSDDETSTSGSDTNKMLGRTGLKKILVRKGKLLVTKRRKEVHSTKNE
ncbi:hypothetical protein Tco_0999238 [Tanacetum coccineum]